MKLGRLNHVGVATPSIEKSLAMYAKLFGAEPHGEPFDLPAQGVRVCFVDTPNSQIELIEPLGFAGAKTIVDDFVREVRPLFAPPPRSFQRTVYRPGEICQFDLWEPSAEIPVGHGQTRRGWVVVACLGYSRAGAGALIFTKQTPDHLAGIARCLWSLGGVAADAGLGSPGRPALRRPPRRAGRRHGQARVPARR